jgi:hypothetical protein
LLRARVEPLDSSGLLPAGEKAGLPIMFLALGRRAAFAPIAQRHPGLTMIIDHMNVGPALVSSTVKDLVAGSGIRFLERGITHLKGVPGECRVYRVEG